MTDKDFREMVQYVQHTNYIEVTRKVTTMKAFFMNVLAYKDKTDIKGCLFIKEQIKACQDLENFFEAMHSMQEYQNKLKT